MRASARSWRLALGLLALTATPASAIVGPAGSVKASGDGAFPWTVAIVAAGVPADQGAFCGGTLIAADRVLTAAHCIDPDGRYQAIPSAIDVVIGQTSLCAGRPVSSGSATRVCNAGNTAAQTNAVGEHHAVSAISLHAAADVPNFRYDAAILTLAAPVTDQRYLDAIVPLISPATENATAVDNATNPGAWLTPEAWGPGTALYLFGWGKAFDTAITTNPDAVSKLPAVMNWTGDESIADSGANTLPRLSDSYCDTLPHFGADFYPEDMMCAGSPNSSTPYADACIGDSGGPLLKRAWNEGSAPTLGTSADAVSTHGSDWRLVGVVSFGFGCGDPAFPGVYTRMANASLNAYANSPAPTPMPAPAAAPNGPFITGTYRAGGALTCHPGTWSNATTYGFRLWKASSPSAYLPSTTDGQLGTYPVSTSDISTAPTVGCTVIAHGPGGYFAQNSLLYTPAVEPPSKEGGVPAPTQPAPADTTAPAVSKTAAVCGSSACRLSFIVLDRSTSTVLSGLKSVEFTLYAKVRGTCTSGGKRRPCIKSVRKRLRATRSADQYVLKLTRLNLKLKPKVRAVAIDQAGNKAVFTVTLRPRPGA